MKVKINVPEDLSEITLGQYMKFLKLDFDEETKNSFALQKMVEIFCNVNLNDIAEIKFSDITSITNHLQDIFNQECKMIPQIELNGVKYGFIPNLDDMSLGEYIDLDNYFHDWDSMDRAMCVLYRPTKFSKNGKYLIEEYKGTENHMEMQNLPLNVVMGARVFFYHIGIELLNHIPNFLREADMTDQQTQIFNQNMDGIQAFTDLLRGTLPGSTTSQN
jgi:hypothetical protein